MTCIRVIIPPKALQWAKKHRTDREVTKGNPKYCVHYRGSEFGEICLTLEDLDQFARMCKFPSHILRDKFFNDFLAVISFPKESKTLFDWLYQPREYQYFDWKYQD